MTPTARVAQRNTDISALVYVNGSVPAEGETVAELAGPKSALSVSDPTTIFDFVPGTLPPTAASDVYLKRSMFLRSFATGLDKSHAKALWATQRPITLGSLNEPSATPAWDTIPRFKAGHLGLITKPVPVVRTIVAAARATR